MDRLIKINDGVRVAAQNTLRSAAIDVGFGQVRLEADGLIKVSDGVVVAAQITLSQRRD